MNKKKHTGIRFGDPRILFETTTTKPFTHPEGIHYDKGAIVRGTAHIDVAGKQVSVSLPSMAEIIYTQARKDLLKASSLKSRSLKTQSINGFNRIVDEESLYVYLQLCSLGILGLYSSLESMVYELYIRKNKERKVMIDGKELTPTQFTNSGFDRKMTSVAAQLSGQTNIHGTELFNKAKEIKRLRTAIQHWDIERREDYFVNLPDNHPLKAFTNINPATLAQDAREILDHYKIKA